MLLYLSKSRLFSGFYFRERKREPLWWGPPAQTNGPGRLDDRGSPQNASISTFSTTAYLELTIGSTIRAKKIEPPRQVHVERLTSTGGILLHKRPADVDPLETVRGAEYERRAAYDRRVEIARREEYDRRIEYDRRNQTAPC